MITNDILHGMKYLLLLTALLISQLPAKKLDIYLLAGQSNMDGRGKIKNLEKALQTPSENTIIFYRNPPHASDGWQPLQPGFSIAPKYKGDIPSETFGPEIGFAIELEKAQPETSFAFIKGSKGGTSLRKDWQPGTKGDPESQGLIYQNFIETISRATKALEEKGHQYQFKGLIWHQGESDKKTSAERHQKRLHELLRRLREDLNEPQLPVVLGQVFDNKERDTIRTAILAASQKDPLSEVIETKDLNTWDPGTHFNASSQLTMGKRFAKEMLKLQSSL